MSYLPQNILDIMRGILVNSEIIHRESLRESDSYMEFKMNNIAGQ